MTIKMANIFESIPDQLDQEFFDVLTEKDNVRIERIISKGHTSPKTGWYDQQQDEWVIVLKGAAIIVFEDGQEVQLGVGNHLNIPAHTRHKVKWTQADVETVWLAVHY